MSGDKLKDTAARMNEVLVHGRQLLPQLCSGCCAAVSSLKEPCPETVQCLTPGDIVIEGKTDGDHVVTIKGLSGLAEYVKNKVEEWIGSNVDSLIEDANKKVR